MISAEEKPDIDDIKDAPQVPMDVQVSPLGKWNPLITVMPVFLKMYAIS
jgi:hypothetical protein